MEQQSGDLVTYQWIDLLQAYPECPRILAFFAKNVSLSLLFLKIELRVERFSLKKTERNDSFSISL